MKVIVGLGNPGLKYANTRHNIGFMVIDHVARELGESDISWKEEEKYHGMLARVGDVVLLKPLTFMNNAGISVGAVASFYKIAPRDVWVIHDDIDLPVGKIRIRSSGGSAGHHGVESIMVHLKSNTFTRFRLGVGRGKEIKGQPDKNLHHRRVIEFVLSRFRTNEAGDLKHLVKRGADAVTMALMEGMDKAMNRFN